jgi:[ribosomal protein S5]-alanine N-acetyltransferase
MNKNIIETERLFLRRFTMDDLDDLHQILGNEKVMEFSLTGAKSLEQTKNFLNKVLENQQVKNYDLGFFPIISKNHKKLIGYLGLISQNVDDLDRIELTHRLNPQYWGQGFVPETTKAVTKYAKSLGIPEIISIIEAENKNSIRVAEKLGMTIEKETVFQNIPVIIYKLEL